MSEASAGIVTEFATGMTKLEIKQSEEVKPVQEVTSPSETIIKEPDKSTVDDLFKAGNIEALVQRKDDPDAQVAAAVLISNPFRVSNFRKDVSGGGLTLLNTNLLSRTLGLDDIAAETIKTKQSEFSEISKKYHDTPSSYDNGDERNKAQWEKAYKLTPALESAYREFTLPIRKQVLGSNELPETYKLNVIEGIKGRDSSSPNEANLLKDCYPAVSERLKRGIVSTVEYCMGYDLNFFDVVPISDLQKYGADIQKVFIATLGNKETTADFVEQKVASEFFPTIDPAKVRQTWEVLKKVTSTSLEGSFASDGYARDTDLMNTRIFENYMENSEELTPIVNLLSEYGFRYRPVSFPDKKFSSTYVDRLKELGKNINELQDELKAIKAIMPDYKYGYGVDERSRDSKLVREKELFIDDNPFALALKQKISYPSDIDTLAKANETARFFESLQKVVTDRWRSGFVSTYIEMMSTAAEWPNRSSDMTRKAISEASKYVFDSSLTLDQVELFATKFFNSSLDARNGNAEIAVKFGEKYADRIRTWSDGKEHVDADATWYMLSFLSSDLYRYPIVFGGENAAIAKAKLDLLFACEAVHKIRDPFKKDKAISNLVFPLTDEEIGDVEKAQIYVDMIQDNELREAAQVEIELEKERVEKGETTTWKKMEKVRKSSAENEKFLKDIFGYGSSSQELSKARELYSRQFSHSPDYYGTFDTENRVKLEQEIARIHEDYHVTFNITWTNVLSALETGRVISAWEKSGVMEYRTKYGDYDYEARRNAIERQLGNRAKGGMRDPHPIYGAAASTNNRDEYYGGTGGGYGECFLVLKTDRIKDRTSFVYDDSFGLYNRWVLDWGNGITAKAIHNLNKSESRHGYVEAEILGGVSIEDIDSINIPSDAVSGEKNKYRQSTGSDISLKIDQLRQKYPNVKINVVQIPTT